jgi:hypothetical protein
MYSVVKSSDNRNDVRNNRELKKQCIGGRTWTRRVQWLESSEEGAPVKLKFEIMTTTEEKYEEVGVPEGFAQTVYDRFKAGQSIEDCVSIFKVHVQPSRKGKKL